VDSLENFLGKNDISKSKTSVSVGASENDLFEGLKP